MNNQEIEKTSKRNERLLIIGRETTKIGNILFDYVNNLKIISMFSSNGMVLAIYQSAETIAQLLFGLLGGVQADKGNKKRILITSDIGSAIVCFIAALTLESSVAAFVLISANFILAVFSSFNYPVYSSAVRVMVKSDRIARYNSLCRGITEIIKVTGTVMAAVVVNKIGITKALVIDGVTFLISAMLESMLICIIEDNNRKREKVHISDGVKYLLEQKQITRVVVVSLLFNVFMAAFNVLVPYTEVTCKEIATNFYSKVLCTIAIGGIIGSLLFSKLGRKEMNEEGMAYCLGAIGLSICVIPLVWTTRSWVLSLLPFLVVSIFVSIYNIQFSTYLQTETAIEYQGRVFATVSTLSMVFVPIGAVGAGAFLDVNGGSGYLYIGIGMLIIGICTFIVCHQKNRG